MKALFLDCDGVINNWQHALRTNEEERPGSGAKTLIDADVSYMHWQTDTWNMWNLKYILDQIPDLQIIISSAWRKRYELDRFQHWLSGYNVEPTRVVGMTPRNVKFTSDMSTRGLEIQEAIEEFKVEQFAILDDNNIGKYADARNFFKTDAMAGLTFRDAAKLIYFLKPDWQMPMVMM